MGAGKQTYSCILAQASFPLNASECLLSFNWSKCVQPAEQLRWATIFGINLSKISLSLFLSHWKTTLFESFTLQAFYLFFSLPCLSIVAVSVSVSVSILLPSPSHPKALSSMLLTIRYKIKDSPGLKIINFCRKTWQKIKTERRLRRRRIGRRKWCRRKRKKKEKKEKSAEKKREGKEIRKNWRVQISSVIKLMEG